MDFPNENKILAKTGRVDGGIKYLVELIIGQLINILINSKYFKKYSEFYVFVLKLFFKRTH